MPYHHRLLVAVGLLFVLVLSVGCSSSASDLISPTSDFWDRRPCVAGARQSPPPCAEPRTIVRRQSPPAARPEAESFPVPAPHASAPSPRPRTAAPAPAPTSGRVHAPASVEEMRVLEEVNRVRDQHALRALRFHPTLWIAARDHSLEQDRHGYMGHGSPDPARRQLTQRMALAGYRGSVFAEVVAWGYPDVPAVVEGWMNSDEHRRILLDPELTEAAFSRVGQYWTGNFGAPPRYGAISSPRPSRRPATAFRRTPAPQAVSRPRPAPRPVVKSRPAPAPRAVARPRVEPTPAPAPAPAPAPFSLKPQTGFG